jgi:hypothetical protein
MRAVLGVRNERLVEREVVGMNGDDVHVEPFRRTLLVRLVSLVNRVLTDWVFEL